MPITHIPNTWDIVKINTFRYQYTANKHRIWILKTPNAKNKVLKFLKTDQQEDILENSIKILNEKLKELQLPNINSKNNLINKVYNKKELEKKLIDAIENKSIYNEIIKSWYIEKYKEYTQNKYTSEIKNTKNIDKNIERNIVVDDDKLINYYLCPECKPTYPQKVIAKTWRDGIKIHTLECRALKTISPNNLLEAHRNWESKNIYTIISTINIDEKLDFMRILEVFTKLQIQVSSFTIKNDADNQIKIIKITRTVKNLWQIQMLREQLKKFWNMIKLTKKDII